MSSQGYAPVTIHRFAGAIEVQVRNGTELSYSNSAEKGSILTLKKETSQIVASAVDGNVAYSQTFSDLSGVEYQFNVKSGRFETRDEELNMFVVNGDGSLEVLFYFKNVQKYSKMFKNSHGINR